MASQSCQVEPQRHLKRFCWRRPGQAAPSTNRAGGPEPSRGRRSLADVRDLVVAPEEDQDVRMRILSKSNCLSTMTRSRMSSTRTLTICVRGETNSFTIVEQGRIKKVERRTGIAKVVVTPQRNSFASCMRESWVSGALIALERRRTLVRFSDARIAARKGLDAECMYRAVACCDARVELDSAHESSGIQCGCRRFWR